MMKLSDTVPMMNNTDYKEMFKAEYFQLKIRIADLQNMIEKWDDHTSNLEPMCDQKIYNTQLKIMKDYMNVLENRAATENIDLSCKNTESPAILTDDVTGHTKYLQGIDLPIMINSIGTDNGCEPSKVCEMHIGTVNGDQVVLITPHIIAV